MWNQLAIYTPQSETMTIDTQPNKPARVTNFVSPSFSQVKNCAVGGGGVPISRSLGWDPKTALVQTLRPVSVFSTGLYGAFACGSNSTSLLHLPQV